jgi:hypothetical protein
LSILVIALPPSLITKEKTWAQRDSAEKNSKDGLNYASKKVIVFGSRPIKLKRLMQGRGSNLLERLAVNPE